MKNDFHKKFVTGTSVSSAPRIVFPSIVPLEVKKLVSVAQALERTVFRKMIKGNIYKYRIIQ